MSLALSPSHSPVRKQVALAALMLAAATAGTTARADLVGWWQMNSPDPNNHHAGVVDSSGNGNFAYVFYPNNYVDYCPNQNGTPNSAIIDPDVLFVAPSPSLDLRTAQGLTLSAWVNTQGWNTQNYPGAIVSNWSTSPNGQQNGQYALMFKTFSGGNAVAPVLVLGGPSGGYGYTLTCTPTPITSPWVNIAATFDVKSQVATIYVNGQAEASSLVPITQIGNANYGVQPSGTNTLYNSGCHAAMDDLRIYNTALSSQSIGSIFRSTSQAIPTPLVASQTSATQRLGLFNPTTGQFTALPANFNPSGDVTVLIHGWTPGDMNWIIQQQQAGVSTPLAWNDPNSGLNIGAWNALASAIASKDPKSQILMYSWVDQSSTATSDPSTAIVSRAMADSMGMVLATALDAAGINHTFSTMPGNQLHVIGFSHGAEVGAVAAEKLQASNTHVDQLTLLDSPEGLTNVLPGAANNVDNVLSRLQNIGTEPGQTYVDIEETQLAVPSSVSGVQSVFMGGGHNIQSYTNFVQGAAALSIPWIPPAAITSSSAGGSTRRLVLPQTLLSQDVTAIGNQIILTEHSPAFWNTLVNVADGDTTFTFDYRFIDGGDGDQLGVLVDGQLRFLFQGNLGDSGVYGGSIDISDLARGPHEFDFELYSYGTSNASFTLTNFEMTSIAVPEPASVSVLVFGVVLLVHRRGVALRFTHRSRCNKRET
jgi:hypothetical protein